MQKSSFQILQLVRLVFPFLGIFRRVFHFIDDRPLFGQLGVQCNEILHVRRDIFLGHDGVHRTLRFTQGAINTFIRIDHQHVGAFMETIHRADLDTIGIFALDTIFSDYEWHLHSPVLVIRRNQAP